MSPECVSEVLAQSTSEVIFFQHVKIVTFFVCVCVPLNANELLLPAQRAELPELVCENEKLKRLAFYVQTRVGQILRSVNETVIF